MHVKCSTITQWYVNGCRLVNVDWSTAGAHPKSYAPLEVSAGTWVALFCSKCPSPCYVNHRACSSL